ncbi:MAG: sensor histidine kinase [Phycisphaerae bacterium]
MTPEVQSSRPPALDTDELRSVLHDYMEATQRLQRTHETLQHEVVRLRSEVESKDRELEQRRRLASLGELAAGVAHEVRNPLGALRLYSGLLRSQFGEPGPALELIEKIDAGIRAIDCVVQDTLALAPRSGKLLPRSLRSIVESAHELCRATLQGRQVALEVRYEVSDVLVLTDETALQRVFVNLIANAAQASPENAAVLVQVRAGPEGQVQVRVTDEGPGVPQEIIEKVFDPFFTTKESGMGLGLTIAHRLVEAHGGRLTARNRPEGGAEFVVALPTTGNQDTRRAPQQGGAGQISAA